MEPTSAGFGGGAAVKVALAYGAPAALAAILGLLIMPPKTSREFTVRSICTVACSFIFGPALAAAVLTWKPSLMEAMTWLARHGADGDDLALARFYVLGPSMLLAGLPAWWVLGAYMQWMSRIRESTTWDLHDGTGTPLANSYAVAQRQRWPGQGLPDYYELAHCCQTAPLRFAVAVKLGRNTAPKTAILGGLLLPGADAALTVTSAAETFFARPQARADGYTELATLFRPYWQARLSPVTSAEALLARTTP